MHHEFGEDVGSFHEFVERIGTGDAHSVLVDNHIRKLQASLKSLHTLIHTIAEHRNARQYCSFDIHREANKFPLFCGISEYPTAPLPSLIERVFKDLGFQDVPALYTVLQQGVVIERTLDLKEHIPAHIVCTRLLGIPQQVIVRSSKDNSVGEMIPGVCKRVVQGDNMRTFFGADGELKQVDTRISL
jgi:hypothetical protein